jgi:hypothetical protein
MHKFLFEQKIDFYSCTYCDLIHTLTQTRTYINIKWDSYTHRKRLEAESEERMTKMKDEALGKLKQLGNSILGNFGMSLDNFNMKQDEKTGSWNIRYQFISVHFIGDRSV